MSLPIGREDSHEKCHSAVMLLKSVKITQIYPKEKFNCFMRPYNNNVEKLDCFPPFIFPKTPCLTISNQIFLQHYPNKYPLISHNRSNSPG